MKVIARLKEMASPLRKWKDVLDVLKDYDFDEYKGLAVIPVGTKHTLAISPNGIKGAKPSSGTNSTILRLELFDGKVATEKALSDNYDVRTDREMRGGSLTKGLKEWLVENDVSSSAANLMAKKISIIYSALANGEKSNSRAGGSGFGSSTSNDRDSKAQTELSLEDMSPINKNVLKVMKAYYPVKAVKGKIISATINGVNVYFSVVEQEACVEVNRGSDGYQRVSVNIPKFPSLLPSALQSLVRELGNNGREVYKAAMLFATLLMYES
jgi:hypothetical protein